MATDGSPPTFGLWYDFRQKPPLGDYARFYAECLEEIEEGVEVIRRAWEEGRTGYEGKRPWERYLVGNPDEVAEGLIRLHQEAPYYHFCLWARLPGVTHEQALESMRLFASEVAPRVGEAVEA